MIQSKRIICITVLFLLSISLSLIPITHAEVEPITIFLDCYVPCKDKVVNSSEVILFELTIRNNFDSWVELGAVSSLSLTVSNINLPNNNGKEYYSYSDLLGQSFLFKPQSEIKIYVPFDIYNKLDKDRVLGDWSVLPKFSYNAINFHKNPFELQGTSYYKGQYYEANSIIGNPLEFKAEKPESKNKVQKEAGYNLISEDFWENPLNKNFGFPLIVGLIIAVFSIIAGAVYLKGTKKRR